MAREDGVALGTVALVDAGDGTGEVKRMFVSDAARGLGVGTRLLDALHDRAREVGIGTVRLETGLPQAAAIALYRKAGYADIPGSARTSTTRRACAWSSSSSDRRSVPT